MSGLPGILCLRRDVVGSHKAIGCGSIGHPWWEKGHSHTCGSELCNKNSKTMIYKHRPTNKIRYTGIQVYRYTGIQVYRYPGIQVYRYRRYTGIQVYRYTGIPVYYIYSMCSFSTGILYDYMV